MKYRKIVDGLFIDRPNRFIAHVDIQGVTETVHVKTPAAAKNFSSPAVRCVWNSLTIQTAKPDTIW